MTQASAVIKFCLRIYNIDTAHAICLRASVAENYMVHSRTDSTHTP